ncbi:substrate-binding domain-containing protein [Leucobacter sp. CSA1]|uniref:Substrate-binding domain-containing protein n=1 Tax=Leucobacter chromiisoli TaxID=2796471 RepID=A0A934Q5P0_9MICO|nr:substrate-binding domain-containing protein [Leucobacter chromiisoli]MBK0418784.1 substrate-binding domain-containing protein [Leucobacter chromiisoli]
MSKKIPQRYGWTIMAAVSAGALALSGCSGTSEDGGGEQSDLRVAMVTPESTGEYYGAMYCGAQAAADEQGVELDIQGTPEVTVEAEMQVLQSVLATEPDGMLLTVWDTESFNSVMAEYTSLGHPVVMPDSFMSSEDFLQSIRTDSYQSSYDAALEVIEAHGITEGKVLINTDSPGNAIQSARAEGFRDAIEKETDLETLEFQYVGGDSAKASSAVTSAAAGNDDLAIVYSTNIGAGTGSANGITTSGAEIVHVGYDASPAQVEQLKSGEYDALIAQSPYQMGYDAMNLISEVLKEEQSADDVDEQTVFSPWALLTADNIDDPENGAFIYTSDCSQAG